MFSIVLGGSLGLVDAAARGSEMGLRMPALLAALVIFATGMVDLSRSRQPSQAPEAPAGQPVHGVLHPPGTNLVQRNDVPREPVYVPATQSRSGRGGLGVPVSVLILAVWLGLAVIALDGSFWLRLLSLIAAFLLFAHGWGLLPTRK